MMQALSPEDFAILSAAYNGPEPGRTAVIGSDTEATLRRLAHLGYGRFTPAVRKMVDGILTTWVNGKWLITEQGRLAVRVQRAAIAAGVAF